MKMENDNKQNQAKYKFGGAIPLLRKFQQDPFWTERRKFSRAEAWIDLLFMARYGTETEEIWNRDELIPIQYAQILTSVVTLARKWKRSRAWVKNFINVLEKKQSISIITMDNRRTILQIVNMGKIKELLQNNEQQTLHQTRQQKSSRKTYKNKDNKNNKVNIISKDITKSGYGNPDINEIIFYFKTTLGLPIIDGSLQKNRNYANLLIKKFGGVNKVKILIDSTKASQFWSTKITSLVDLYYKAVNIISSGRKLKFRPTEIQV